MEGSHSRFFSGYLQEAWKVQAGGKIKPVTQEKNSTSILNLNFLMVENTKCLKGFIFKISEKVVFENNVGRIQI